MYLVVTIDTEEDNWGEYQRSSYSVENITRIPQLQRLFDERGIRPTYLISYPVATSATAIELLGKYRVEGRCEIGSHPHPWNTPPVEEDRSPFNSYISHLPASLQFRKLSALHDAIRANYGVAPTSYRSGRWALSDDVVRNLVRLGYRVDSSISAGCDWRAYLGPDYSNVSHEPFMYRVGNAPGTGEGCLLEVPATGDFVQSPGTFVRSAYRAIGNAPQGKRMLALLARARVLNHVVLSPELSDANRMIRLARALRSRGAKVLNMYFHSPTLMPAATPFVKTETDAVAFVERIGRFLDFARSAGVRPVTLSELSDATVADLSPLSTRQRSDPGLTLGKPSATLAR
jgi:hypothetical protein